MAIVLKVKGTPVPQGSMTCVGGGTGRPHNVQPSNKAELNAWRNQVAAAARQAKARFGAFVSHDPVRVDLTFTFARPKSVTRDWPSVYPDVDKLMRAVNDGLTLGEIWADDGQALGGLIWKTYPDMAAFCPFPEDVLDVPGVTIRLSDIAANRLI